MSDIDTVTEASVSASAKLWIGACGWIAHVAEKRYVVTRAALSMLYRSHKPPGTVWATESISCTLTIFSRGFPTAAPAASSAE